MIGSSTFQALPPTVISGLALVLLAADMPSASAQSPARPTTPTPCTAQADADARTKYVLLKDKRGSFEVDVHEDMLATIELPGEITSVVFPRRTVRQFWRELSPDRTAYTIKPQHVPVGQVTTVQLVASDKAQVIARVRVVGKAEKIEHSLFRVRDRPPMDACKELLASHIAQEIEKQRARDAAEFQEQRQRDQEEHERELREREAKAQRKTRVAVARHVLDHATRRANGVPVEVIQALSNPRLDVRLFEPEWNGNEFLIPFELQNQTGASLDFTAIEAADENGNMITSEVLALNGMDPAKLPVTVPHDVPIRGVLSLPSVDKKIVTPLRLSFMAAGTKPVVIMAARWYPTDMERILKEQRMSQTSLNVGLVGGARWFSDGANQSLLEPAGFGGIAIRLQKGYYWGGALEATVIGGRTGQARFDGVDWNGTQGDITQQATVGRVLGGFAMRFGDKLVFTGRLGLGLQTAYYSSTFRVGDTVSQGPSSGIAFAALLDFGGSVDARLGEHATIGLSASSALSLATTEGASGFDSLTLNLQAGYGW